MKNISMVVVDYFCITWKGNSLDPIQFIILTNAG